MFEEIEEKVISGKREFTGVVIDVEHWDVQLPDGRTALREVALHKGASAVVPVDKQGRVAMVHQYRTPLKRVTIEIPAGKLDSIDEDPFEAAKRELREETGLKAEKWRKLVALRTTPGFCNETIHIYMAEDLSTGETDYDDDEFINVEWVDINELCDRIVQGEIEDSKTISALMMTREILRNERKI